MPGYVGQEVEEEPLATGPKRGSMGEEREEGEEREPINSEFHQHMQFDRDALRSAPPSQLKEEKHDN
jgi:hypothetical protein